MTLAEFAKKCGVRIEHCGPGWGGKYGYVMNDYPNVMECGFKTHKQAYEHWFKATFGETAGAAVVELINGTRKNK